MSYPVHRHFSVLLHATPVYVRFVHQTEIRLPVVSFFIPLFWSEAVVANRGLIKKKKTFLFLWTWAFLIPSPYSKQLWPHKSLAAIKCSWMVETVQGWVTLNGLSCGWTVSPHWMVDQRPSSIYHLIDMAGWTGLQHDLLFGMHLEKMTSEVVTWYDKVEGKVAT